MAARDSLRQKEAGEELQQKVVAAQPKFFRLQAELTALTDPAVLGPVALGVRESTTVGDTEIRIRAKPRSLARSYPAAISLRSACLTHHPSIQNRVVAWNWPAGSRAPRIRSRRA